MTIAVAGGALVLAAGSVRFYLSRHRSLVHADVTGSRPPNIRAHVRESNPFAPDHGSGSRISGQIRDVPGLQPGEARLTIVANVDGNSGQRPVRTEPNGSFITEPLAQGTYALRLVRSTPAPSGRPILLALATVAVRGEDVSGVELDVRPETTVTGTYRMESDNRRAEWPPHIHVLSPLVIGEPLYDGTASEGARGGRFTLHNAFGPRVLRTGYTLHPDHPWWFSRVLLDGKDVTDSPTDFSRHEQSKLEVVFTQHPARLTGVVVSDEGRPAPGTWILTCAAGSSPCESWHTTSQAAQAEGNAQFSLSMKPGRYLVWTRRPNTFVSSKDARRRLADVIDDASDASTIELSERETKRVRLIVK